MTIGTILKGGLSAARVQDSITSAPVSTGGSYGTFFQKSWSGGDSFPTHGASRLPKGKPLRSTYMGKKPKVVWNPTPYKGDQILVENSWTCTYETKRFPEGAYLVYRYSNGNFYDRYGYKQISFNSMYDVSLPPVPVLSPDKQYQAIAKLANAIRGSDFNAAVFSAQLSQGFAMIGDSAQRIGKALLACKKGNLVKAFDVLVRGREGRYFQPARKRASLPTNANSRSMSANWLELQYGWLPLLSDTHEAAELLAHQLNVPFKKRYRSTVSTKVSYSGPPWPNQPGAGSYTIKGEASVSRRTIVEIAAPPNMTSILGLENPLSVAWEVLPWSFVIDWFIPIGNYLQANADVRTLNVSKVITTDRIFQKAHSPQLLKNTQLPQFTEAWVWDYGYQGYLHEKATYVRTVGETLNVPLPEFKPLNKVLTVGHALNALALLTQRFTSK